MRKIRLILSILIALITIGLAIYIGFFIMFVGGIMGIAKAFDAGTLTAVLLACNIIKIFLAGIVGYAIFIVGLFISKVVGGF